MQGKNKYQRSAREHEYAFARFDVDAGELSACPLVIQVLLLITLTLLPDLTPLFHWNTKQLFLQLTAEYLTPQSVRPCPVPLSFLCCPH